MIDRIKIFVLLTLFVLAACQISGQKKPVLKFNSSGKFKIIQFTDTHFQHNSVRSDSVKLFMRQIIAAEKPDLVVITGDIVLTPDHATKEGWISLTQPLVDAKVPWAVVFGNHDAQQRMSEADMMRFVNTIPYNLSSSGPGNVEGFSNYVLQIQASSSKKTAELLYFLDSHEHPFDSKRLQPKEKSIYGVYDWIRFNQVQWYRRQSEKFTKANHNSPYPALAFFHIPIPEYKEIIGKPTTVGFVGETVCSPDVNSGLFASFIEKKDVMGVFTGHDHNNNYIGTLMNIALAYGSVTGRQCYGKTDRGARVIVLTEGERKFETYLYTTLGVKKFEVTYPDSFK
jgi:hypothetical protein